MDIYNGSYVTRKHRWNGYKVINHLELRSDDYNVRRPWKAKVRRVCPVETRTCIGPYSDHQNILEWLDEVQELVPEKVNLLADIKERVSSDLKEIQEIRNEAARRWRSRQKEARLAKDDRTCIVCSTSIKGFRAGAKVCSDACRMKEYRKRKTQSPD